MDDRLKVGTMIGHGVLGKVNNCTPCDKENSIYIPHDYNIPLGYLAYIFDEKFEKQYVENFVTYMPKANIVYGVKDTQTYADGDILEIHDNGTIKVVFSINSSDNVLYITNNCNSNCIMCPDSEILRKQKLQNRMNYLTKLIELMPSDVQHLTITGGEPTLLKWDLISILEQCKSKFQNTDFLLLSNGRSLSDDKYCDEIINAAPNHLRIAVPIYSASPKKHDEIIRVDEGFDQTIKALKKIQHYFDVEIRIVMMKLNYMDCMDIADLIIKEIPKTKYVSFMGIELLGNAAINKDKLWIDFDEAAKYIEPAAIKLLNNGINPQIYNFPLCSIPRHLWSIVPKSISPHKIRYKNECENCRAKNLCGGFFFSTINYNKVKVNPILEVQNG